MIVRANLTNIPLSVLKMSGERTCWNGLLLNFTQYYDFTGNENSTLTRALTDEWRRLFPARFQNISSEEMVEYLIEAKETKDLYNNHTIPCLRSCLGNTHHSGQNIFYLRDPASNDYLYRQEFPKVVRINCDLLRILGNPDIGGIGLFSAYVTMVAIFSLLTIAHVYLLIIRYKDSHLQRYLRSKWESGLNAASIAFLDSATFLSVSLLVAGVSYMTRTDNYYESTLSVAVSGISAIPLVTLTVIMYPTFRRKPLRVAIASLAALLYSIHGVFNLSHSFSAKAIIGMERSCLHADTLFASSITILITFGLCLLVPATHFGYRYIARTRCWRRFLDTVNRVLRRHKKKRAISGVNQDPPGTNFVAKVQLSMSLAFIIWGQALTWTSLYSIIEIRRYSVRNRSSYNSEGELSYGQVVSLFIWLPVCVDFAYTALYGSKQGLEGNIPVPFVVDNEVATTEGNQHPDTQLDEIRVH
ncbi:hypothetical protein FS842_006835 [Serendipita sp. 407]|nr:hypothetical protein FS842_006835 [Serendipita sp. 407]